MDCRYESFERYTFPQIKPHHNHTLDILLFPFAGLFYWVESLQSYDVGGWAYTTELHKFVDSGMSGSAFIDAVSGIVNRGCHNPPW